MYIIYFKGAGGPIKPTNKKVIAIGTLGFFTVNGLAYNPTDNNLAYIYVTDSSINGGTFQVLKVDFSSNLPNYVATPFTMGFGSEF